MRSEEKYRLLRASVPLGMSAKIVHTLCDPMGAPNVSASAREGKVAVYTKNRYNLVGT